MNTRRKFLSSIVGVSVGLTGCIGEQNNFETQPTTTEETTPVRNGPEPVFVSINTENLYGSEHTVKIRNRGLGGEFSLKFLSVNDGLVDEDEGEQRILNETTHNVSLEGGETKSVDIQHQASAGLPPWEQGENATLLTLYAFPILQENMPRAGAGIEETCSSADVRFEEPIRVYEDPPGINPIIPFNGVNRSQREGWIRARQLYFDEGSDEVLTSINADIPVKSYRWFAGITVGVLLSSEFRSVFTQTEYGDTETEVVQACDSY